MWKIGIPIFGYQNFSVFEQKISKYGFYTANLGDNLQSAALRNLLKKIGVSPEETISINKDTLRDYNGVPVALIMNGVFQEWCFPTPDKVKPIFIGLCVSERTVRKYKDYFLKYEPIGCRDLQTKEAFERNMVRAYVSGCVTMTFPKREVSSDAKRVFAIYGDGSGAFPTELVKHMPADYIRDLEFLYHRIPVAEYPLSMEKCLEIEELSIRILKYYTSEAKLVITPLHHVAAPCMASGVPVIICRKNNNARFSYIEKFSQVYTPENFQVIDWNPKVVSLDKIKKSFEDLISHAISSI